MRIGVIGAGALGGTIAALLDRAGHRVAVTARGPHLTAIREHGLRLDGAYGDHVAQLRAAAALTEPPELAVLAVKAQDGVDAARTNAAALRGVPVVVVQNGLAGPRALRSALQASPLVGALSMIAASHLAPGRVTVTAAGATVLARDTADDGTLGRAAAVLGAVLDVAVTDDLESAQWAKLVVNQLNAAPAITGLPLQEAMASPALAGAIALAMRETVRTARAAGVRPRGVPGAPPALLRLVDLAPARVAGAAIRRRVVARMGSVPNPGSTLQSLRRGRPTEIDHLSGAVVAEGERRGVPTPVNRRIVEAVHEVERTGRFLAPEEAAHRLLH